MSPVTPNVVMVLRSGGDYRPEHVRRLANAVRRHLPGATVVCLSDQPVEGVETIPLEREWPGWWAKMELFRPDLTGDLLYLDLDTIVTGDLSEIAAVGRLAIMRDVYRPAGLQSSIMYLPAGCRAAIWEDWTGRADHWIRHLARGGDQAFLERHWRADAARWQDLLPGQIVSWKVDCRARCGAGGVPPGARCVIYHGRPRPWETPLWTETEDREAAA